MVERYLAYIIKFLFILTIKNRFVFSTIKIKALVRVPIKLVLAT
jgi:hypothetical protein